jgi:hypothetical protein
VADGGLHGPCRAAGAEQEAACCCDLRGELFKFFQGTCYRMFVMKPFIVSPVLPFPNIAWWRHFSDPGVTLLLDLQEHFEKMSFRNRYMVAGADGMLTLSIPLAEGRQQRKAMKDVLICNQSRWQLQHWRTLTSVYGRAPYFEHYAPELEPLFITPFEHLADFSIAAIRLLQQLTGIVFPVAFTASYQASLPEAAADLRAGFRTRNYEQGDFRPYYQSFAERHGFLPNLSILDLLFSEGPAARGFVLPPGL